MSARAASPASAAPRVLVSGVLLGQPLGGVRRHNAELLPRAARLLAERGGALAVLEGAEPISFELPASVERIRSAVPGGPAWRRFVGERAALARALAAARARGAPFDLVHTAHLPVPGTGSTPFALTVHDLRRLALDGVGAVERALYRTALRSAVRRAAAVITVSATVAGELGRAFPREVLGTDQVSSTLAAGPASAPAPDARASPRTSARPGAAGPRRTIYVVPNGADHLPLLPRRAAAGAPLLALGHLEPRKNLELLLRALALDRSLPDLVLAGAAKAGEEARLRALARELGVLERVRFRGPVDDERLPELFAEAACVVVPSLVEGFGLAAVEAARAGAPLAVADAGALPEVAGPDVPRFDARDPAAAVRAIRAALATPPAELAERARSVAARFAWDTSARALVQAWTEACASG